jgi:hypothetical protein
MKSELRLKVPFKPKNARIGLFRTPICRITLDVGNLDQDLVGKTVEVEIGPEDVELGTNGKASWQIY